jgi:hypothetical protein
MHHERIPAAAEAEADATVLELLTGEPVLWSVDELTREMGDHVPAADAVARASTAPGSRADSATSFRHAGSGARRASPASAAQGGAPADRGNLPRPAGRGEPLRLRPPRRIRWSLIRLNAGLLE